MFLRRLGKRGAEMVEYAIVLACIAAVGVGFYSSNDSKLTGVLDSLFGNVRQVLGLADISNKYNAKTRAEDAQYTEALNSLINGLHKDLSQEDAKLQEIWINSSGDIQKYKLYGDRNFREYKDSPAPNVNDLYLTGDYKHSSGQSHLYFSEEGLIVNGNIAKDGTNGASRVYITGKNSSPLFFNSNSQDFGKDWNYYLN